MGQYFRPVIFNSKTNTFTNYSSWSCNNGANLTEHSYVLNNFCATVLLKEFLHKPKHLAWVGDYADADEDSKTLNLPADTIQQYIDGSNWKTEEEPNKKDIKPLPSTKNLLCTYIVNHTKKEYIDMEQYFINWIRNVPSTSWRNDMVTNPVPLLTAIGNGKGGGDYHSSGTNFDKIGYWATDLIEVVDWHHFYIREQRKQYKDYKDITKDVLFIEKD